MSKALARKAFTLIELLVVVAIIALLISILLPSLSQAREQGKRAVCLSHLKSIGQASHSYATEDRREMIVPLSMVTVRQEGVNGMDQAFYTHIAEPASFGGRTPTKDIMGMAGNVSVMRAQADGGNGYWEAHRRPLNGYVYGDIDEADAKKLEMFHCPSDTGYPQKPTVVADTDDSCPQPSWNVPLYDMLGNSYRINTCGFYLVGQAAQSTFSTGAQGHIASSVDSPSRVAMYCEPLWYTITLLDTANNPTMAAGAASIEGWHKKLASDVVCYCDGSARLTRADQKSAWDQATLAGMGVSQQVAADYILRRGQTWQTDCYPAPGALILKYGFSGQPGSSLVGASYRGWPFDNYTVTENPDN